MPDAKLSLLILFSLTIGCENAPKNTYLMGESNTLHQIEHGDSNTFAYADLDKNQFGEVKYSWSQSDTSNQESQPNELNTVGYFVEENTLDTQADGFFSARFFQQVENGDLKMLGFRSKEGSFWIRSDDDNGYGLYYVTSSLLNNEGALNVSGSVVQCELFVCTNVGSISWTSDRIAETVKDTPYGKFETIKINITGTMNIATAESTFPNSFFEGLSIYPPVGVVHREIEQGVLDNLVWIDMKLSNTNIVIPEALIQIEESN